MKASASILGSLSPTIVAQLTRPSSSSPAARARYRGQTRRAVRECRACPLRDEAHVAFSAMGHSDFCVVGEAPGPREAELGRPFVGPSGKLLRALMNDVGIDPDDALWANTVSCFPNVEGKVRAPSEVEVLSCREHLLAQVEASYSPFVLLVGAKAFGAFRSDLAITAHHGRVFVWNDTYVVMGIIHPAAALRGARHYKKAIREDLEVWRDVVYGGDDPLRWIGSTCAKCPGEAVTWDRDGVPWCESHVKWAGQWQKERLRWTRAKVEQLTF